MFKSCEALIRVCDVNGDDSSKRDRGWSIKVDIPTFEWTGIVECWRTEHAGPLNRVERVKVESSSSWKCERLDVDRFFMFCFFCQMSKKRTVSCETMFKGFKTECHMMLEMTLLQMPNAQGWKSLLSRR